MARRVALASVVLIVFAGVAWLRGDKPTPPWREVAPGVWRSTAVPYGHALEADGHALLIDAPHGPESLASSTIRTIDGVLLTHHHLDTCAKAAEFVAAKIPVRAPKASAEWLTPAGVAKFWRESIPLRNSRTAYFVVGTGIDGIDYSLDDGQTIEWRGWTVKVVSTPGHSRDHVAFAATRKKGEPPIVFSGDALAEAGKLWVPFTTDWDHWTDAGLTPTAQSLRKLADLKPSAIYPAHGEPITKDPIAALGKTAAAVEEVAFLKSFERFSKQRLGNAPTYPFLVPKEQVASAGDKPWSKVSDHVYITGNTYVLISKDDAAFAVIDPWGARSVKQVEKLKDDLKLGRLELVMFSHAHYDHYDGVYDLPGYASEAFKIWSLDRVAEPIGDPLTRRAPFLDARPVRFDRRFKDGETGAWREFTLRFHHLPGQSEFTMGVESTIDGKRCYFTADNFFHQDQYSGTGGWMGLNRSWPLPYSQSAQKVLDAAAEWILAEHGGPYVFNAEDYRRRVKWGEECAVAADAVCESGHHRVDWDPYRVQALPVLQKAKPGATIKVTLVVTSTRGRAETFHVDLDGRKLVKSQTWTIEAPAGKSKSVEASFTLPNGIALGRYVFPLRIRETDGPADAIDVFFAVDVE